MDDSAHNSFAIHSSDLFATLRFSQRAPLILDRRPTSRTGSSSPFPATSENPEDYALFERLFFSCLQSGDDESARRCLDGLTQRFGPLNERIMGLHGLYEEAIAENSLNLEKRLHEYDNALLENPVNVPIQKRRVALLCSMSRPTDAISALIELLESTPTDAEAWCELSDLYQSQGMCSQAIFSLEEALLISPNAWNIHARLGELLCISASSSDKETRIKLLGRSLRFFCRSIELCDDYLRGLYGLTLVSSLLLESHKRKESPQNRVAAQSEDVPSRDVIEGLHKLSTKRLADIVQSRSLDHQTQEYSQSELIAAKELLNRFSASD